MIEDVASYYASRLAATTGIDYDDLLQEARIAEWKAIQSYNPDHSSLKTYMSRCLYNRLLTVVKCHGRKSVPYGTAVALDSDESAFELIDNSPSQEDVSIFADLLRQLPEDAKILVHLVLSDVATVSNIDDVKQIASDRLSWAPARIRLAITCISVAFKGDGFTRKFSTI